MGTIIEKKFSLFKNSQWVYVLEVLNSNYSKIDLLGFFLILIDKFPIKAFAGDMDGGGA